MIARARGLIPLDEERKERLFGQVSGVTRAIVLGTTLTALVQGALVGIGFAIASLPSPLVFGVLAALLSMLPVGGAAIVWVPAIGWLLYQGRWGFAIFMLAWGLMLSGVESVLRPFLISGRATDFRARHFRRRAGRHSGLRRDRHRRRPGGAFAGAGADRIRGGTAADTAASADRGLPNERTEVESPAPWTFHIYSTA